MSLFGICRSSLWHTLDSNCSEKSCYHYYSNDVDLYRFVSKHVNPMGKVTKIPMPISKIEVIEANAISKEHTNRKLLSNFCTLLKY